jgi:hypothetical protein
VPTQALPFNKQKANKKGVFKHYGAGGYRFAALAAALLVAGGIIAVPVAVVASLSQMGYMVGAVVFALYFMVSTCLLSADTSAVLALSVMRYTDTTATSATSGTLLLCLFTRYARSWCS